MNEERTGNQSPPEEALLGLYNQGKHDDVVTETDRLLEVIGKPNRSAELTEYCFNSKEEFLLFVLKNKTDQAGSIVWSTKGTCRVLMYKAAALYELGRFSEAAAALREAIQYNPVSVHYRFELAENLIRMLEYKSAISELRSIMEWIMYPEDLAKLYRRFGFCYIETKDTDAAVACLAWSLQFEKSEKALRELMYIRSTQVQGEDAESLKKVFSSMESPGSIISALGQHGLLFLFTDARKTMILEDKSEKGLAAAKLYTNLGLIQMPSITKT